MVPYIHVPVLLEIGPVKVYTFGTMVGLAIVMGLYIIAHRARQTDLNPQVAEHLHYWTVAIALLFGHFFNTIFYEPGRLSQEGPLFLLKIWDGMSSMGGIIGGLTTAFIFMRIKKVKFLPYLDAYFYAFTFAWAFARLGCSLVHDHPGQFSDFFLAVQYPCAPDQPEGAICSRHDLGFYEFLSFSALSVFFFVTRFKPRMPGFYILSWGLVMGPLRFASDFLRIEPTAGVGGDQRYWGLTPAQIAIIPLVLLSIWTLFRQRKRDDLITPHPVSNTSGGAGDGGKR